MAVLPQTTTTTTTTTPYYQCAQIDMLKDEAPIGFRFWNSISFAAAPLHRIISHSVWSRQTSFAPTSPVQANARRWANMSIHQNVIVPRLITTKLLFNNLSVVQWPHYFARHHNDTRPISILIQDLVVTRSNLL